MRVILNVDAISAPLTGIGRYALELARGLRTHAAVEDLKLYSIYRWVDSPEQALHNTQPLVALRRHLPFKSLALEAFSRARAMIFPMRARGLDDYVLHAPNYVLMPFAGAAVTTVHDLSWLDYPETHPVERVRWLEKYLPESLERARVVVTDSDFMAGEIERKLGVPRKKLRVVPLGVDASYRPHAADALRETLARYGLEAGRYLLVVATLEPRKNLARLARAYAALPAATRSRAPLAIVGARGWLNDELERTLAPLEAAGEARRLGYVDEADLPLIYAGASAFAFPSFYEGFGLPVLEALASGVPVLTTNVSSLPEVAGDVALTFDPFDETALRDGLARLLDDDAWRASARVRGPERAAAFPWSRCVDETVDVYRDALSGT